METQPVTVVTPMNLSPNILRNRISESDNSDAACMKKMDAPVVSDMKISKLKSECKLKPVPLLRKSSCAAVEESGESSKIFTELKSFLLLLSFSTDTLLNSRFTKNLKNVTRGQAVFFVMIGFVLYYNDSFGQRIEGPLVKTKQGFVQGITGTSRGGRIFYEFLGIPYATPPLGQLRFEV